MVKVITGLRRSGKSFLLFNLYRSYLNSIGVDDAHIIEVALDDADNYVYHNPRKLLKYIRSKIVDSAEYYIFIDEIQFVKSVKVKDPEIKNPESITFYSVVNALLRLRNVDVYVTGSNSSVLNCK